MTEEALRDQISRFIGRLKDTDVLVATIRYGAHLPAIFQLENPGTPSFSVLLSHFIDFMPPTYFANKRFVVLDDTVYQGKQMKRVIGELVAHGVPPTNITSAAVVLHNQSEFRPDYYDHVLSEPHYVVWKEAFASLVRAQLRPIDGDHPLYYFDCSGTKPGDLLSLVEQFGVVQAVGDEWFPSTFAYTLNVDSSVLTDILMMPGVTLPALFKLRFYWKTRNKRDFLTIAPMTFFDFDFSLDALPVIKAICGALGVANIQFETVYDPKVLYYYLSRSASALLLFRLLERLAPMLKEKFSGARTIDPIEMDSPVLYDMPIEYHAFYNAVRAQFDLILGTAKDIVAPIGLAWNLPVRSCSRKAPLDIHIPQRYDLTEFVARTVDPAVYVSGRWSPNPIPPPSVTFTDLVGEFRDPLFVSASLDELLDIGLLKAHDHQEGFRLSRRFAPGGEYNAVRVSRLRGTLVSKVVEINEKIAREESRELWDTN
jgi:hypothetical protein